jgi:hypothetical protein
LADNVQSNATTTAGAVFATDEISGIHHSRVKVEIGADGTATDVSSTNPMPVRQNDGSANQTFAELDLDSGGGTVSRISVGLAIPSPGGPVAGGSASNPLRIDPTGATVQPVRGYTQVGDAIDDFPVSVGARARATAYTTANPDDAAGTLWCDGFGRLVAILNTPAKVADGTSYGPKAATVTSSGDTALIAAPGSGSIHVTQISAVNSHGTLSSDCSFKDGSTVRVSTNLPALSAGGLHRWEFNPPWKLTATTALNVNCSAAANVIVTVHFYVAT